MSKPWIVALLCVLLVGCSTRATAMVEEATIDLPPPRTVGDVSLEETLAERRSVRAYTQRALTWEEIGQLLWAAQGITRDWGARTAPSAGALYPIEVYVVTGQGLYHYVPETHQMLHTPAPAGNIVAMFDTAANYYPF